MLSKEGYIDKIYIMGTIHILSRIKINNGIWKDLKEIAVVIKMFTRTINSLIAPGNRKS